MDHETPFRIALLVIFVLGMPIGGYHRFKAAASRERLSRREEGFVLVPLRLCGLVTFGGIIAYLIDPEWMRWSALPLPDALRWAGAVVGAASLPLLLWTLASLGRNLTDTVVTRRDHTLVTAGPYRYVRHPFYVCGFLFLVGVFLLTTNVLIGSAGVVALILLTVRTPTEERKLVERFGDDYRDYMKRTARFIPRFL